MKGVNEFPGFNLAGQTFGFVEHFTTPVYVATQAIADNTGAITVYQGQLFSDFSPDSGATVTIGDAHGGVVALASGNTDNNEAYLYTTKEIVKFQAGKPFAVKASVQYTESNTDDANVFFGVIDAAGVANTLVDNGGGLKTTASGAAFVKVDGGTNWKIWNSISTTQNTVELTAANSLDKTAKTAGGSTAQVLEIHWNPTSSKQGWLNYIIDGNLAYRDLFTFTNATEMNVAAGVKAGSANGGETVNIDYIAFEAKV